MYLLLLPLLHFVFSGALPVDSWDNPPINWLDEAGLCRQTASLAAECRHCICVRGQAPACTRIDCPQTLESEENKCKPGSQWKEECNKCYCDENGISYCTVKDCQKQGHLLSNNKELWHKLEGKLDENGKCVADGSWALDCNICLCSKSGELYCTNFRCTHRHKRASGKIPAGGKCSKPGERWKLDECNDCVCTHTGYASCTLNECTKPKRPKRSPAVTGQIPAGGKCNKPGERWKLDECNDCVCTHTGYASCTLNECTKPKRPKRSPAVTGKIPAGGKCSKPGERWKLDECNDCVCTHTGYASCTLNECTKPKRPKRNPSETELRRLVRGACDRGVHFAVDECNTCTCVDGSALDCTQNICAPLSDREKRSPIIARRADLF